MGWFCQDFGAYISKIVNRFNLKENKQVFFQSFACDKEVNGALLCSNVDLRVDCHSICTCIIGVHSNQNMKAKVSETFQQPSNMAGTVGYVNEFCFGSCISQKTFFCGRTEPASGRIGSALCVRSSRISRTFFAFHFLRLVHPDAPLSHHSVRRACCGPTPSSFLPLLSAPLSSRLLASCLLRAVARVRRPSLLPSHLWRPRSV